MQRMEDATAGLVDEALRFEAGGGNRADVERKMAEGAQVTARVSVSHPNQWRMLVEIQRSSLL
jgi:hypothetical protein